MSDHEVTKANQDLSTSGDVHVRLYRVPIAQHTLATVDVGSFPILEATGNLILSGVLSLDLPAGFDDPQYSAGSVTCITSRGDLDLLGVEYQFVDYSRVARFLEENPYLVSLLLEALTPLQTYLPGASLSLEVVIDPDARKGDEFVVTARRDWKVEEALEALDKFNDAWWLDNIQRAADKVTFTVERK